MSDINPTLGGYSTSSVTPSASSGSTTSNPAAPAAPKEPRKGVYVLEPGDTPGRVSTKLYGRGNMAVDIARANPDAEWVAGEEIVLP